MSLRLPLGAAQWAAIVGLVFVVAFGVRLSHIVDPPLDFHATRQYRSLLIARAFYFDAVASVPEWQRTVADASAERQGILEPPILEKVVALGYQVLGGEQAWLARVMSSAFWLVGGAFLYLICMQIGHRTAALFATAFYLFVPFGIVASRTFQPDPLMVMLILASIWAMLRYDAVPSRAHLAILIAASASACLIKPMAVFVIVAVFVAVRTFRHGLASTIHSRASIAFVTATVAPTVAVYLYGVVSGTFLVNEAQKTLLPGLVLSPFFWSGWLANVRATVGLAPFVAGLSGVALSRGLQRPLLIGAWIGYGAFCLALNYNVATHNYYQLQLIPIVALSIVPLIEAGLRLVDRLGTRARVVLPAASLCVAMIGSIVYVQPSLSSPGAEDHVRNEQTIGELVGHSTRTLFLSGDYGNPLQYNGFLSGSSWPLQSDLEWESLAGRAPLPAADRFTAWFGRFAPIYFVVEDLDQLKLQPDLERFLADHAVVAKTDDYVVFDLERRAD